VDDEITLETTMNFSVVDRSIAIEQAALGDRHLLAVLQVRPDAPLDDKPVARIDFARQRSTSADD
jgi:hypothetical protein